MAHECPECGFTCYCNGDIDDLVLEPEVGEPCCIHCPDDWYSSDDDEEYEEQEQLNDRR
jgi:Zn-finger nucleic acid-binding protein